MSIYVRYLSRSLTGFLLLLHVGLGVWAGIGFIELVAPGVPWPPLSNPLFPPVVLFFHWTSVLIAAVLFVLGYLLRWPLLPVLMISAYGAMAVVCAVETFGFMVHNGRYVAMAVEYLAYLSILLFLFRSGDMRQRFGAAKS
ncbi:MAG: hypothetical protein JKY63_04985 [Rhodobiaceae bacterium]|nr:hypothetical protein [Rhodobiaceae bacterium]